MLKELRMRYYFIILTGLLIVSCKSEKEHPSTDTQTKIQVSVPAFNRDSAYHFVKKQVEDFIKTEIDALVLGCTHFLFLEKEFKKSLGTSITVIDSREGVGKQILRLIKEMPSANSKKNGSMFFHTGTSVFDQQYSYFANLYNLKFKGSF